MSRKALKVVVEVKFRAVSCPGVHLPAKDDIYLSMCFMGQYRRSECLPAVFPLLFHEKMTFEKVFRYAVDPGDIAVMLEYETVRIELVQLIPPVGDTLACFEEDARSFLFPEPKLVPSFSGVEREVLMTRAPYFPGIAPRMEFSTKTTILECPADAEINIYPNVPMRPFKRQRQRSRPRTSSPQRKPQTLRRRQSARGGRPASSSSHISRSRSMSPLRAGNTQRLARLSLDSATPSPDDFDTDSTPDPMLASWPESSRSASPHHSAMFTKSSSTVARSPAQVRFSSPERRSSLSNGVDGGSAEEDSSSSEGHESSAMRRSYREQARHSRSLSSPHRVWEEVHDRVRGLLTTPKAVRRLVYGASNSEVDEVLARRSISPGPP
ncbi:spermatogenesis associated 6-like protein [Sphaeramia orbicularis]|uniref:spermatogenesis associated 6-like protein n=1 Tax=Sphaeramia orbicularis TaxID=375764 RepID=UPI00117D161D|nr:spermatogenesis-associated protein 6-like [Sphaeramia orbicularis]